MLAELRLGGAHNIILVSAVPGGPKSASQRPEAYCSVAFGHAVTVETNSKLSNSRRGWSSGSSSGEPQVRHLRHDVLWNEAFLVSFTPFAPSERSMVIKIGVWEVNLVDGERCSLGMVKLPLSSVLNKGTFATQLHPRSSTRDFLATNPRTRGHVRGSVTLSISGVHQVAIERYFVSAMMKGCRQHDDEQEGSVTPAQIEDQPRSVSEGYEFPSSSQNSRSGRNVNPSGLVDSARPSQSRQGSVSVSMSPTTANKSFGSITSNGSPTGPDYEGQIATGLPPSWGAGMMLVPLIAVIDAALRIVDVLSWRQRSRTFFLVLIIAVVVQLRLYDIALATAALGFTVLLSSSCKILWYGVGAKTPMMQRLYGQHCRAVNTAVRAALWARQGMAQEAQLELATLALIIRSHKRSLRVLIVMAFVVYLLVGIDMFVGLVNAAAFVILPVYLRSQNTFSFIYRRFKGFLGLSVPKNETMRRSFVVKDLVRVHLSDESGGGDGGLINTSELIGDASPAPLLVTQPSLEAFGGADHTPRLESKNTSPLSVRTGASGNGHAPGSQSRRSTMRPASLPLRTEVELETEEGVFVSPRSTSGTLTPENSVDTLEPPSWAHDTVKPLDPRKVSPESSQTTVPGSYLNSLASPNNGSQQHGGLPRSGSSEALRRNNQQQPVGARRPLETPTKAGRSKSMNVGPATPVANPLVPPARNQAKRASIAVPSLGLTVPPFALIQLEVPKAESLEALLSLYGALNLADTSHSVTMSAVDFIVRLRTEHVRSVSMHLSCETGGHLLLPPGSDTPHCDAINNTFLDEFTFDHSAVSKMDSKIKLSWAVARGDGDDLVARYASGTTGNSLKSAHVGQLTFREAEAKALALMASVLLQGRRLGLYSVPRSVNKAVGYRVGMVVPLTSVYGVPWSVANSCPPPLCDFLDTMWLEPSTGSADGTKLLLSTLHTYRNFYSSGADNSSLSLGAAAKLGSAHSGDGFGDGYEADPSVRSNRHSLQSHQSHQ